MLHLPLLFLCETVFVWRLNTKNKINHFIEKTRSLSVKIRTSFIYLTRICNALGWWYEGKHKEYLNVNECVRTNTDKRDLGLKSNQLLPEKVYIQKLNLRPVSKK